MKKLLLNLPTQTVVQIDLTDRDIDDLNAEDNCSWMAGPDDVYAGFTYDPATQVFAAPMRTFFEIQTARIADVDSKVDTLLTGGYPHTADLHIALDDGSRTDLSAMATAAGLAISGIVSWPGSYQQGWIAIENIRIPLPTPQDGIALAAPVGDYYGAIRQNGRALKDAILGAADATALDAIDITAGWPEA
jgi:hypothetical protein